MDVLDRWALCPVSLRESWSGGEGRGQGPSSGQTASRITSGAEGEKAGLGRGWAGAGQGTGGGQEARARHGAERPWVARGEGEEARSRGGVDINDPRVTANKW